MASQPIYLAGANSRARKAAERLGYSGAMRPLLSKLARALRQQRQFTLPKADFRKG
jgi:hypothetical protein